MNHPKNHFYKVMGVDRDINPKNLKRKFLKLSLKYHPDKNQGDPKANEKYQEISRAYEVLSDSEKKKIYDEKGYDTLLKFEAGGNVDSDDEDMGPLGGIFDMLGGRMGMGRRKKNNHKIVGYPVTLSDCYNGLEKEFEVEIDKFCYECVGKGGKDVEKCPKCKGRGEIRVQRMMGPQIMIGNEKCDKCKGNGKFIKKGSECKKCEGKGSNKIKETVNVKVEPGAEHGNKIIFKEKGNDIEEGGRGDLILVLQVENHDRFQRKDNDLLCVHEIDVFDALCGTEFTLDHVNGEKLLIKTDRVINDKSFHRIVNKGMPYKETKGNKEGPKTFGDLYIVYNVSYPETLTDELKRKIREAVGDGDGEDEVDREGTVEVKKQYGEELSEKDFVDKSRNRARRFRRVNPLHHVFEGARRAMGEMNGSRGGSDDSDSDSGDEEGGPTQCQTQ